MAIFEEQVLEPFVAKGIGNSGVASRQIQAGNLPDLSAAVRQSQISLQNLASQRESVAKAGILNAESKRLSQPYQLPDVRRIAGAGYDAGSVGSYVAPLENGKFQLFSSGGKAGYSTKSQVFGDLQSLKSYIESNPYLKSTGVAFHGGVDTPKDILDSLKIMGIPLADALQIQKIRTNMLGVKQGDTFPTWSNSPEDPRLTNPYGKTEAQKTEELKIEGKNAIAKTADMNTFLRPNTKPTPTTPLLVNRMPKSIFDIGAVIGKKLLGRK